MIGIDIVSINRIEKLIEKFGKKALDRYLSDKEQLLSNSSSSLAGFWAAKEAGSKAIGTGIGKDCSFFDMKLKKTTKGQPVLKYKKHIRKKFGIKSSSLSITHDGGFAIAMVVNNIK